MVGLHHRLDVCEFEQAVGVGDGQGSLACCSPWGGKVSDTTEWLTLSLFIFNSRYSMKVFERRDKWVSLNPGGQSSESFFHSLSFVPIFVSIVSVQWLSPVWLFATPWTAARQASLSITNSWSLHKLTSIELVMPSNYLILCRPLLLLPSIFPSIRIFSNESVLLIRWPKYCSFSFSISPSNEYSGLIPFRMDWLDLLAAQGF